MSEQQRDLESRLQSMTTWSAPQDEPTLWRAALDRTDEPRHHRLPSRRVLGIAAVLALAAVGAWATIGSIGHDRGVANISLPQAPAMVAEWDRAVSLFPNEDRAYSMATEPRAASELPQRAIQRSAVMEVTARDVRPFFDRVTAMVDPALGEFVEAASATEVRGEATLRVAADRLDTVMRTIREMDGGVEVTREELSATDVTDRRTDLAARLTNERCIEAELLELIESRPDAPLGDVLKVRDALNDVRLGIERLEAQQSSLAERVSLATLRVRIERADEGEASQGLEEGGVFAGLGGAFARGTRTLADSAAWLVEVAVGGLLLWALLAIAGTWAYRTLRWRATWA